MTMKDYLLKLRHHRQVVLRARIFLIIIRPFPCQPSLYMGPLDSIQYHRKTDYCKFMLFGHHLYVLA